jgi:MFS family permease
MGPFAGRLTDKVGARPLLTTGLIVVSAAIFLQSGLTVHTSYLRLLPGFMLMGVGIGLVMSPMSTAAMNSVDRTKAGAASGVLSMSRMVGGTFGVAVMGALIAALGRSQLDHKLPELPASTRASIADALGSAGGNANGHHVSAHVVSVVREAFVSALGTGLAIGSAVTLCGAILAWTLVEKKLKPQPTTAGERPVEDEAPELAPV